MPTLSFLASLQQKLKLPTDPQINSLAAAGAATPTTANTVTSLASYSSPALSSFDIIESNYMLTVANAHASNNYAFTLTMNYGTARTGSFTVNAQTTSNILVNFKAIKTAAGFITTIMMTDGTSTVRHNLVVPITSMTQILYSITNPNAVASTTITGLGGYVLLDRLT